jgi:hypothetical protein
MKQDQDVRKILNQFISEKMIITEQSPQKVNYADNKLVMN